MDCVIVGGGPAGLAAGIHLARAGYRAVLLEKKSFGGQAAGLAAVENYPGFPRGVTGKKLMSAWLAQARGWGLSCRRGEAVRLSRPAGGPFSVKLKKGGSLSARSVIWCAGAAFRRLGAAGEDKFSGRGVWNTADEAPSCRGLTVVVAGGGEAAVQQAALALGVGVQPLADSPAWFFEHMDDADRCLLLGYTHLTEVQIEQGIAGLGRAVADG